MQRFSQDALPNATIDDLSALPLKDRIKRFSKKEDDNDLVRIIRRTSKLGTPTSPLRKMFHKAVDNTFSTSPTASPQEKPSDKMAFSRAPNSHELEILQQKLEKANDQMSNMLNEQGLRVLSTDAYDKLLLDERDDCKKKLIKAGGACSATPENVIREEKNKINTLAPPEQSSTVSDAFDTSITVREFPPPPRRRSLGPRKRSDRISAPRLQELDVKYVPKVFEKTSEDIKIIRSSLSENFVFRKVTDKALEQMLQAFEPLAHYKKGDAIIKQGEIGDYFYILGKGSVVFEVNESIVSRTDKPGSSFGELALLYESPRNATVRASSEEMRIYRVDQMTFRYILQSRSKFKAMGMQAVTKVKAINRLLGLVALATAPLVRSEGGKEEYSDGEDSSQSHVLLNGDEYNEYFESFTQMRMNVRSSMSESMISLDSFTRESILGEGQFGEVWLVQPSTEKIATLANCKEKFALKIQSKSCMHRMKSGYSTEEAIRRECDVLSSICHPFIVDFVHDFEDDDNIYMVMGAIHGKELWDYIHRELESGDWTSGIPEDHAKFYGLIVADTLNYMHQHQICHRDIKPENIMINKEGYPVLVDFGFAKVLPDDTTFTLCGTPKYTAPEVIMNDGHGCAVDQWSLGVVIYEMVSGENPFWYEGISDLQLFEDICNQEPYPIQDEVAECSEEVKDIVLKMLEKNPSKRLVGSEVTLHPWFDDIDIYEARKAALVAPWIPSIKLSR